MEKLRKLCPGVVMQSLRCTEPGKFEHPAAHGACLLFCVGGSLRAAIEQKSVTLRSGGFCLLGEAVRRGLDAELPQGRFEGFFLCVEPAVADAWSRCSLGIFAPDFSAVLARIQGCGVGLALSAGLRGEHVCRELYETAESDGPLFTRLKLAELFLLLAECPIQFEEDSYLPRGQEKLIRHLRDHIVQGELNYSSLRELAEEHGISVSLLQKCFKQVYGLPVYQYLKTYRMEKAAAALHATDRSVTTIALDAGYTNAAKFSEAFRKQYGLPPSEYRRTQNQNG